jgi:hypothetical protein
MTTTNLGRVAIVPKGTYTAGTNKPLDLVRYNGSSYIAKTTTTALPTVTTDWDLVAGDGASLYTWVKYADDSIGTGLSDSPANKIFIGIAVNKTSATESTVATDYTWSQIKGNDGSPTYTWIKYADDAIGTGLSNTSAGKSYIGIAVNKTSTTESTTAGDYEWSLIIGDPLYTWVKYADDSVGGGLSGSPTGKSYLGIATNKTSATESTTASDYTWSLVKGADGGGGTVTSVAALTITTTGTDLTSTVTTGNTTPVITINVPSASATVRGVLTSTDWSTFNSKQDAITFGANVLTFIGTPSSANLLAAITDETGTGSLVFNTTPTFVGLRETRIAVAANDIALATGNYFTKTISGATTLTVSGTPSAGITASFILDLTNGGSATITWWSGVKWVGGIAPTLTSAGRDSLGFYSYDGGTTWTGLVLGKDIK